MKHDLKQTPETDEFKKYLELCYKVRDNWFNDTRFQLIPYWAPPSDLSDEKICLAVIDSNTEQVVCGLIDPMLLHFSFAGHTMRMIFLGILAERRQAFHAGKASAVVSVAENMCKIVGVDAQFGVQVNKYDAYK